MNGLRPSLSRIEYAIQGGAETAHEVFDEGPDDDVEDEGGD